MEKQHRRRKTSFSSLWFQKCHSIVPSSVNSGPMVTLLVEACGRSHLAQGKQEGAREEERVQGADRTFQGIPPCTEYFFPPSAEAVSSVWDCGFNPQVRGDVPYSNRNILSQANPSASHSQCYCFLRNAGSLILPTCPQLGKGPVSRLKISTLCPPPHCPLGWPAVGWIMGEPAMSSQLTVYLDLSLEGWEPGLFPEPQEGKHTVHCFILHCTLWLKILLSVGKKHFTHYPCAPQAIDKDRLCSVSRSWQGPEGLFCSRSCVLDGQLETWLLYQTNKGRTEGWLPYTNLCW